MFIDIDISCVIKITQQFKRSIYESSITQHNFSTKFKYEVLWTDIISGFRFRYIKSRSIPDIVIDWMHWDDVVFLQTSTKSSRPLALYYVIKRTKQRKQNTYKSYFTQAIFHLDLVPDRCKHWIIAAKRKVKREIQLAPHVHRKWG